MGEISRQLWIVGEVGIAMVLGAVIGLEREIADKPAGFRTHIFLAAAAAFFVALATEVVASTSGETAESILRADPIRTLEAIIAGVSFLGAGTIIRDRDSQSVKGLTTASSLLLTAGVGIAVGAGLIPLAVSVTLLSVVVLFGLGRIERAMNRRGRS